MSVQFFFSVAKENVKVSFQRMKQHIKHQLILPHEFVIRALVKASSELYMDYCRLLNYTAIQISYAYTLRSLLHIIKAEFTRRISLAAFFSRDKVNAESRSYVEKKFVTYEYKIKVLC